MAKKQQDEFVEQDDPKVFTTSGGKQIRLSLFPPLQMQMMQDAAKKKAIKDFGEAVRPTYRTSAGEDFPHDETTLETDEDKAAWAKYQEILAKHSEYVGTKTMRFVLFYGVDMNPDDDPEWQERQKYWDIEIPDGPIDRKIHYIQSEFIFSQSDIEQIMYRIAKMSGVRQEAIDAASATFSDSTRDGGA